MFGISPKGFARAARVEKIVAARIAASASWADVAYARGFADQAHMINDHCDHRPSVDEAFRHRELLAS